MYLSAERIAVANQAVLETFEQTSVAWQAIPHWDTCDAGQARVRRDLMYNPPPTTAGASQQGDRDEIEKPFVGDSLKIETATVRFYLTVAQACAPTPDSLLATVTSWTAKLAGEVDGMVFPELYKAAEDPKMPTESDPQHLLEELIDARADVENAGYRAPSCLFTDTEGLKKLTYLVGGEPVTSSLLTAANINSLHRTDKIEATPSQDTAKRKTTAQSGEAKQSGQTTKAAGATESDGATQAGQTAQEPPPSDRFQMILLGRRQRIAHGGAAEASPGEEPVDLAVSSPPSLEVVGETDAGYIELAVRIRFATRVKDVRAVVVVASPKPA
jgi:hypothetical protein